MIIRQGDVFLKKVEKVAVKPTGKKVEPQNGRLILAFGEATGHHHSVPADVCEMYEDEKATMLVVNAPTTLDHQEHATIEINPGVYWVVRQREWTDNDERRVMD